MQTTEDLVAFAKTNGRVCPQPTKWNELWHLLPNRKQLDSGGWHPPLPLILGAWWDTTKEQKRLRLEEHIRYANQQGCLEQIANYLCSLRDKDWHHEGTAPH